MKRRWKREIFACARLKVLSYYYSFTAENREVKALHSFQVLLHQANLDFAYLSKEAWKSACLTYKLETHNKLKKTLGKKLIAMTTF